MATTNLKKFKRIGFLVGLITFLSLSAYGVIIEKIYIQVNDNIITLTEYQDYWLVFSDHKRSTVSIYLDKEQKKECNDLLVEYLLVSDIARQRELLVQETTLNSQVIERLDYIKKNNNLQSDADLVRLLQMEFKSLTSINQFKTFLYFQFAKQYMESQIIGSMTRSGEIQYPSDDELQKIYQEHLQEFKLPDKYNLSNIVLTMTSNASWTEFKQFKKLTDTIVAKIESGEMTFDEAAREYSEAPNAENGGALGDFDEKALLSTFPEYTDVLKADAGAILKFELTKKDRYENHIVKVNRKSEEKIASYGAVKQSIASMELNRRGYIKLRDLILNHVKYSTIKLNGKAYTYGGSKE